MRDHLLGAVLAVYPGKPGQGPAVIDDVIRVAKVSRGTFYKYYPSLEEAVAELGAKLAAEMVAAIGALYDSLEDPIERSATAFQLYLSRAIIEPKWGVFVAHLNHLKPDHQMISHVATDFTSGSKAGLYDFRSLDVAVRLLPVDEETAREMIRSLRGAALLDRFRGRAPRDVDALVRAMTGLSRLFLRHRASFEDIEINPLIVLAEGDGVRAVDVRTVRRAQGS